jgi:Citrate lyase beta subunit
MKAKRLRRTSLYIPGTNPGMLANASVYGADSIILDLEDGVPVPEKDAARILVRNALKSVPYRGAEVTVRVNALSTPFGRTIFGRSSLLRRTPSGCRSANRPTTSGRPMP